VLDSTGKAVALPAVFSLLGALKSLSPTLASKVSDDARGANVNLAYALRQLPSIDVADIASLSRLINW
jgi:hypothetical protein